jgi:NDP-sugar pyrophosphorylase family protein
MKRNGIYSFHTRCLDPTLALEERMIKASLVKSQTAVKEAMVLAAGLGTRLQSITFERPKPLVEVMGVPLLRFSLHHLLRAGIERVVINTHHLHDVLVEEVKSWSLPIEIVFSHEPEILGTGGGIKRMSKYLSLKKGPILILNADALIDLDVEALIQAHLAHPCLATLVLKDVPEAAQYGAIGTDIQGWITDFAGRNAPQGPVDKSYMFCGVHLVEPGLFEWLPANRAHCINQIGYPRILEAGQRIYGHVHHGYFCDVGTPERHLEANFSLLMGKERVQHLSLWEGLEENPNGIWRAPSAHISPDAKLHAPLVVREGATVGSEVELGPKTIVGRKAELKKGSKIESCVVLAGTTVPPGTIAANAIFSPKNRISL